MTRTRAERRRRTSRPSAAPTAVLEPTQARLLVALAIFTVALVVRLLHVWSIRQTPFFDLTLGDAAAYDDWARRIAGGEWIGHAVFYQAPLYPYVLAVIYRTIGSSVLVVRVAQAVLSAASCALLADAGWRLFSKPAGIAGGLMLAIYPPAIFLDTLVQKSVLDLLFLCLIIWVVARIVDGAGRAAWVQLGVALGALSLTRENAMALAVPLAAWIAGRRAPVRARVIAGALFAGGVAAMLAPVALRNEIVGHEFFVTTSQFGPNLYIGNNEQADGTYKPLRPLRQKPAFEQQDAIAIAEQAAGRTLTPAEVSSYYTGRVAAFIRADPARWLRLLGRKALLTWNATEISDTEDQYTYARWSPWLGVAAIWNLGVLAPLAAFGIWATAPSWRRLWILHAMLAVYVASVVLFYVFARYRYPIVPFLMLDAAAGLTSARAFLRSHSPRAIAAALATAALVAIVANLPLVPRAKLEAATLYNFGVGLEARGRVDEALDDYRSAVALDADLAPAHIELGLLFAKRGDLPAAARELGLGAKLSPATASVHNNLAVVLAREGDLAAALPHLAEAVHLEPGYDEARRNLNGLVTQLAARAEARARAGQIQTAVDDLRLALAAAPDRADLHNDLGILLAQQGDLQSAERELSRALALSPSDASVRRNLERLRDRR